MSKATAGNFFEDFRVEQSFAHATPRTLTDGDVAVFLSLYGSRFALQSSTPFANSVGYVRAPLDDLLVFHVVIGKSVPDISLNAVANLGYAECQFLEPVFPGDTLTACTNILGVKENSNGATGIVYVETSGANQNGNTVLRFKRWVMVRKRDSAVPAPKAHVPKLSDRVAPENLVVPNSLSFVAYDEQLAGGGALWGNYEVGEKIDHVDGITVEEAEHMLATRLYQNTARIHFNQHAESQGRFGRRLIYGGHVISLARALSFNGLANAQIIAAINGGQHVGPFFAGETVFAWSEVLERAPLANRVDAGALRLRLVATKDRPATDFPYKDQSGKYEPSVILDFDYWAILPRRD